MTIHYPIARTAGLADSGRPGRHHVVRSRRAERGRPVSNGLFCGRGIDHQLDSPVLGRLLSSVFGATGLANDTPTSVSRSFAIPNRVVSAATTELDTWRHARATRRLRVKAGALCFGKIVEPALPQQLIQPPVEGVARGRRQIGRRDPDGRLLIAVAFVHRHATHCSTRAARMCTPSDVRGL